MLIGLCGGRCAGKQTVANWLVENHGFEQLALDSPRGLKSLTMESRNRKAVDDRVFTSVEELVDFVTCQWQKRWVFTGPWTTDLKRMILKRPFFLLVSIEAPLMTRFTRSLSRDATSSSGLEHFVCTDDAGQFQGPSGQVRLTDSAQVRLINDTTTVSDFHAILVATDLLNFDRLRPSWDQYFMELASLASCRSNCMKRRVGCVLVRDRRVISTGYNGTPRNLTNCNDGGCMKCNQGATSGIGLATCLCLHAEENALLEAGRERIREGTILYCNTCPCLTCSIKICQVGISEVVYSQTYNMDKEAALIFREAGVTFRQFISPSRGFPPLKDGVCVSTRRVNFTNSEDHLFIPHSSLHVCHNTMTTRDVWLLDYVAGNVRSLINAIEFLGYNVKFIKTPQDIAYADRLILPGVGHFGHCLTQLRASGFADAILEHIRQDKPFFAICVGLQALFESSEEAPLTNGFGIVPGSLKLFDSSSKAVPHIGWNSADPTNSSPDAPLYGLNGNSKYYYVHSYAVPYVAQDLEREGWTVALGSYGNEKFIGAITKGNLLATQFHPEKSGAAGLRLIESFLAARKLGSQIGPYIPVRLDESTSTGQLQQGLTRRVIACLDVRSNEIGDLVVTKGDQYDVHDRDTSGGGSRVRNMGKPIALAQEYYHQGADEITFLNITSFRNCPVADLPMLEILRKTSETVFVPLTVGGGIQDTKDVDGRLIPALEVATLYFKSGADKVSIGSDAVYAAENLIERDMMPSGSSAIETISATYGRQAVVVSIDPTRVYVRAADDTPHTTIRTKYLGPQGEAFCWYQCTVKGGREKRDLDVVQLARAVEKLGAGELLLNCIDRDGSNRGFDLELVTLVKSCVSIPVIASSGAGTPAHFVEVFGETSADAALGAGMFHRREYTIGEVKRTLAEKGFVVRPMENFARERPNITASS